MALRRARRTAIDVLDATVWRVGAAALTERTALLGQSLGTDAFTVIDRYAFCSIDTDAIDVLADAFAGLAANGPRRLRPERHEVARAIRVRAAIPAALTVVALCDLACERLERAERLVGCGNNSEGEAARAAAEELVCAATHIARRSATYGDLVN